MCVGAQWTQAAIQLPAAVDNNSNVRIGFNWTNNDDGVGDDPSVAINNVRVVDFVAPPTETPTAAETPAASATPTAAETAIATATDAPIASPTPTPAESEIPTPTPTPTTVPTEQALSEDSAGECSDGDDNDSDGAIDCADPDCAATSVCISVPAVSTTGSAMLLLTLLTLGGISIVRVRRQ